MKNTRQEIMLGSCLALGLAWSSQASAEELRIGSISPVTGIFAQIGKDMVDGFQLYLDEHGGKLGGADVKFIVEDSTGKPDGAVTKAKNSCSRIRYKCSSAACWPRPAMPSRQ